MTRTPPTSLRLGVQVLKCAVVSALAFVTIASAGAAETSGASGRPEQGVATTTSPHQGRLDALMARHECSATGFGPDVIPGSALVLQQHDVRHVSFDDGWAVYTGDTPGTLLAVCRLAV